jgi:FkbM family methyltransferase
VFPVPERHPPHSDAAKDRAAVAAARAARAAIIHIPPRRRGIRFADVIESFFGRPQRPLRSRHASGYNITCDLNDAVQRSLFYRGTYEPVTSTLVRETLVDGDTFLDVGANAGHYTFLAAREVGTSGSVYAIEASPSTAALLAEDVCRNGLGDNVHVHNVAALDRQDRLPLYGSEGSSPIGMRSLHLEADSRPVAEDVEVIPLDDLLPDVRPAVIKVDVEGADLRALVGMRQIIERAHPRLIVVEAEDEQLRHFGDSVHELTSYLQQLGYSAVAIDEPHHPRSRSFVQRRPY